MLSSLHNLFQTILTLFDHISKPSPKYLKDQAELELSHNRNKAFLLIAGSAFFSFALNLIVGNGEVVFNIQGLIAATFITSVLFITIRLELHPTVFNAAFNLYVVVFGVLLMKNSNQGIIGTAISTPIYPILVYFLTGSIGHFMINLACGIIFLNTVCEDMMQKSLMFLSIDETTKSFIYFSNQNIFYSLTYTAFIHYAMHSALYKIKVAEEKKDDFEKQKNFLLGFSHELRNLINSLMGNVKLASLEHLSDKVKDLLLNAEVCAELLLHLVNNILDTGKVEIGELEINPVPTRVYDTVERIWSICSELIKRKSLMGKLKMQKNIPQVLTLDHYRITQLFLNLVGNAVKYTDTGSIDISVEWIEDMDTVKERCFQPYPYNDGDEQDEGLFEKEKALAMLNEDFMTLNFTRKKFDRNQLSPRLCKNRGVLKISVSDTGCGILKEELDKVFERFTQGNSDPSKKKLGTGLGLFITKELCHRMIGDVKVYSKRGVGSTFLVCLPVQPVTDERAFSFDLEAIEKAVNQQHRLRAMIVDDERFCHFILRDFLTKLHVDVVDIAENGSIAVQRYKDRILRKDVVNIITMDLHMPMMDGKVAAQKIREFEVANGIIPCLMLIVSGNCSESEIKECLDKNGNIRADAFVKKPVSIDELCRIIAYHVGQSQNGGRVRLLND